MIAVLKGDIIASRRLANQGTWLLPLKSLFATWGETPRNWLILSGDFFQLEVENPEEVLLKALMIKALIKKVAPLDEHKKISAIDVRMAIGIGEKTYSADNISESNGSAFIYSSEKFELLKKEHITIGLKTPWKCFDEEMNLYLKLAGTFIDKWSVSSAELVEIALNIPNIKQEEIGRLIGIKQNSVSGRWNRAYVNELLEVEKMFRNKINPLIK